MEFKYKCPICGCEECYILKSSGSNGKSTHLREGCPLSIEFSPRNLIDFDIEIFGDAYIRNLVHNVNATVCLCKKCGHVDLFASQMLREIENDLKTLSKLEEKTLKEIKLLDGKLKNYNDNVENFENRLSELKHLIKDENKTIKEHNNFVQEEKIIREDLAKLNRSTITPRKRLEELNKKLEMLTEQKKRVAEESILNIKEYN